MAEQAIGATLVPRCVHLVRGPQHEPLRVLPPARVPVIGDGTTGLPCFREDVARCAVPLASTSPT
jgi:hypothetical protein